MTRRRLAVAALAAVAIVLAAVVLAAIVAWFARRPASSDAVDRARAELEAVAGPRSALRARRPERVRPTADQLEFEIAARDLGFHLRHRRDRPIVHRLELDAYAPWCKSATTSAGPPGAPPAEVRTFLEENGPQLARLHAALAAPGISTLHGDTAALSHDWLQILWLGRLLLVASLDARLRGDAESAHAHLEAVTRLVELLREPPFVASQVLAGTLGRECLVVARHVDGVPVTWVDRLDPELLRAGLQDAVANRAHRWLDSAGGLDSALTHEARVDDNRTTRAWRAVAIAVQASGVGRARDMTDSWRELDDRSACGPARPPARGRGDLLAELDLVAGISSHGLAYWRLDMYRVRHDLTRRVLELKAARDAHPARAWPAAAAGDSPGTCPGLTWLTTIDAAGARIEPTPDSGTWFDEPLTAMVVPTATRWSSGT